jgi:uncharacterized membrane protein
MTTTVLSLAGSGQLVLGFGVGPLGFERPAWLLVYLPIALVIVLIARRTLAGGATRTRLWALALRLVLAAILVGVLARPQLRRTAKDLAVTFIVDVSRSQPKDTLASAQRLIAQGARGAREGDQVGLVTVAREAGIQKVPAPIGQTSAALDTPAIVQTDATDLASGVRAAMSIMPPGLAGRLVLLSDGNETAGDLLRAARAAETAKVPIDVLPTRYSIEREVIADRLIAPANARPGEVATLRVVLVATRATSGRLTLLMNGTPVDLDPQSAADSVALNLRAGTNVEAVAVRLPERGPVSFKATFEPANAVAGAPGAGDTLGENNSALAVTFIAGQGRVLVLTSRTDEASGLVGAISMQGRTIETRGPTQGWESLAELGSFECVVMVNVASFEFNQQQQEELRSYVHDLGGGMVIVGGDQSYGAGGWIGSTLAEVMPVKLDPPQKRQMPRGALALIMHSCEVPEGNFWGRRTAEAAIKALQAQDLAGVVEYDWGKGGGNWVYPMSVLGDKSAALRALQAMTYGDAPSFDDMMSKAITELTKVQAGQKHAIIISDGDPSGPAPGILQQFIDAKVSVSTVAVFPHGGNVADLRKMERIARQTGGNYYEITQAGQLNSLPEIFVKEAQTVKRSLIWEGDPVAPTRAGVSDGLRGIGAMPRLSGYVVTADREGLSQVILRGPENDPLLAQWQHGLGRVVAWTSDASSKWTPAWQGWGQYRQFWDQHLRWAMRPASDPNVRVVTSDRGDTTSVVVEATDDQGERLNFLRWQARAVRPDGTSAAFDLVQAGPGRYEATIDSALAGAYTLNMSYQRPGAEATAGSGRGSVQVAVTKPYADEFRSLRDNAGLLEQVAQRTGGRVLSAADAEKLWERGTLVMPVSLRPIWLALLVGGLCLLVMDVAVRRVRIDVWAIGGRIGRLFGRAGDVRTGQTQSLASAREKARAQMRARAMGETGADGATRVGQSVMMDGPGGDRAGAGEGSGALRAKKFEATKAEIEAAVRTAGAIVDQPSGGGVAGPVAPIVTKGDGDKQAGRAGEAGISRLKKAKQRAQDELREE